MPDFDLKNLMVIFFYVLNLDGVVALVSRKRGRNLQTLLGLRLKAKFGKAQPEYCLPACSVLVPDDLLLGLHLAASITCILAVVSLPNR